VTVQVPAILPDFQHCVGWGGGTATHFKGYSSVFFSN